MSPEDPLIEVIADAIVDADTLTGDQMPAARAVYAAIAATGRLAEPGTLLPLVVPPAPDNPGETWQEWGYRVTHPGGEIVDHHEEDEGCWDQNDATKLMAEALTDYGDGCTAQLIRRTAWYATSAWEVAP